MKTAFESALEGLRATRASVGAHEVVEALARHGSEEMELLDRYRQFIEDAELPATRYLVQLIVDDEERHHLMLEALANSIAWGSIGGAPRETLPVFPTRNDADRRLGAETRALLGHEIRDRTQLRRLARRLRSFGDAPLWVLLVDIMRSDTEKHIRILRLILRGDARIGLRKYLYEGRIRWRRIWSA